MNILFTGGGTAGHIIPAVAIAEALKKRIGECNIAFVGREGGKENEIIAKNGLKAYTIPIHGIERRLSAANIKNTGGINHNIYTGKIKLYNLIPFLFI